MTANNEILMGEKMGISNTPNVKAQEEAHHHLHQCHEDCHDKNVIGHTILPFFIQAQRGLISLLQSEFEPSKSDTTPKLLCDEETSRVSQQRQGGDHRTSSSSSSSPTVLEPSDVSSMTSTSRQFASALPFRLRQQTMHIPTIIVVRMNGATVDSGNSTNDDDAQLLSEDSNDASSSSLSTTDTTIISNAISTFSSWIQPNQKPLSSSDGVTTTSSNDQSSTFSSWVRPDSPMVSKNGADATTTAEGATLP